jgi:hypothetical protein
MAAPNGVSNRAAHKVGALTSVLCLVLVLAYPGGGHDALGLLTDAEGADASLAAATSFTATTYYLHNAPTPPTGDTNAQANLGMDTTAPTAIVLYNYDQDQDAVPGRLIVKGGSGAGETSLSQYQNWRGPTAGLLGQTISGTVTVEFWCGVKSFTPGVGGDVRIFLRDVNTLLGTTSEIGNVTVTAADWQGGVNGWVKKTASLAVNTTLLVGHRLEVKLEVGSGAGDDMWFAYDTNVYRSRVRLP